MKNMFKCGYWIDYLNKYVLGGLFAAVGISVALTKFSECLKTVYRLFLRPTRDLNERYGNGWAVITDVSDSVGEEYAKILGKYFNILILYRKGQKQNIEIFKQIENEGKKALSVIIDDAEDYQSPAFQDVIGNFANREVAILVINNACDKGKADLEGKEIAEYLQKRIVYPIQLARVAIPNMLKRAKKSAIVTLTKMQNNCETFKDALTMSVRGFMESYSKTLACEHKKKIDVTHIEVGAITEEKNTFLSIPAKKAVASYLGHLGNEKTGCGHWKHFIQHKLNL